ncbi:hypothetical protein V6N11_058674 [Hibiscus sabdariffa]|uniref:Uncharacterized protein n=1 Tax=Hibiscus sabdariffa TaxID=183260 RepID=A0ABR2U5S5_9ROSI
MESDDIRVRGREQSPAKRLLGKRGNVGMSPGTTLEMTSRMALSHPLIFARTGSSGKDFAGVGAEINLASPDLSVGSLIFSFTFSFVSAKSNASKWQMISPFV